MVKHPRTVNHPGPADRARYLRTVVMKRIRRHHRVLRRHLNYIGDCPKRVPPWLSFESWLAWRELEEDLRWAEKALQTLPDVAERVARGESTQREFASCDLS